VADSTTALAPATPVTTLIVTPQQYTQKLQTWQANYHVLAPFSQISTLPPNFGLMYTAVTINPDAKSLDGDVYDNAGGKLPWLQNNERALAKRGLRKIAEALGISYTTKRTDPRTIANYWEIKAVATYLGLDGAVIRRESTQDWDLRDGSPRVKGFSANQLSEARKNGLRNCETRAINAVIRECGTGLPQKFTAADLVKPFIGVRVVYQPDMSDPDTRRILTERHLAGTSALYPASRQLAEPAFDDLEHDDAPAPQQRQQAAPPIDAPGSSEPDPSEAYGPIKALRSETKKRKSGDGTFLKWFAVDAHGVEHNTIRADIGKVLEQHFAAKTPVQILSEDDGYGGQSILEVEPYSGGAQGLPGMGSL